MRKYYSILFLVLICLISTPIDACTIFIANDGRTIWIGNNEDENSLIEYRMWYYPSKKTTYGYTIWTELSKNKLLNKLMYKNPQGGLNEHGLFMDYTAIDELPVTNDPSKKNRKRELVHDLLKSCKTVHEALAYINKYNLIKLTEAQLFIADTTGDYATIHGSYIVRKTTTNFALTNYSINDEQVKACYRRDITHHYLNSTTNYTLPQIKKILQKSTQKPPQTITTNFSMAINLNKKLIYLYNKNNFSVEKQIDLTEELYKGKHNIDIANYFPTQMRPVLTELKQTKNIDEVLVKIRAIKEHNKEEYYAAAYDLNNIAVNWIDNNRVNDAIKLLETLQNIDTSNIQINNWLGVAYRKMGDTDKSNKYFTKVLAQNPNDYLATLWGKQINQKITFKLDDFEGAKKVALIGDFTEGRKKAIPLQKMEHYWFCEAELPKGEITYKFWVNDEILTDKLNYMHEGKGAYTFSKFYVWE